LSWIHYNKTLEKIKLFLNFFVLGLLAAPLAVFFKLDLFSNELLIFAGPVIYALASSAGEFYKPIL
jgi:hypothetical protein